MLSFVDNAINIKVFQVKQDVEGHVTRERVGTIRKKDFEIVEGLKEMSDADRKQVGDAIDFYTRAKQTAQTASLYNFPVVAREVVELCTSGVASDAEAQIVLTALMEGLRMMRKAQVEKEPEPA